MKRRKRRADEKKRKERWEIREIVKNEENKIIVRRGISESKK